MGRWIKKHKALFIVLCVLVTLVIAVVGFVIFSVKVSEKYLSKLLTDETAAVERRDLVESISATGTITSLESKSVVATVTGTKVSAVLVSVGDVVKEGDLICELDASDLEATLAIAEANLEVSEAASDASVTSAWRQYNDAVTAQNYSASVQEKNVEDAAKALQDARDTLEKYGNEYLNAKSAREVKERELGYVYADINAKLQNVVAEYDKKVAAGEDPSNERALMNSYEGMLTALSVVKKTEDAAYQTYIGYVDVVEKAQAAYDSAVAAQENSATNSSSTVASAYAGVTSAQNNASVANLSAEQQIDKYKDQIENCKVYAPFSGVVTAINVSAGDTYAGGAMIVLEDTSAYEITTYIDEYDISKIREGQEVVIKTNGTGDLELAGKVKSVAPRATTGATVSGVKYQVVVSLLTQCDDLKLDMTAKMSIIITKSENAITVPYESVQTDDDGNKYVEVQTEETDEMGNKISKKVYVRTGIESSYYIEITEGDIAEGMTVIVPRTEYSTLDLTSLLQSEGELEGF